MKKDLQLSQIDATILASVDYYAPSQPARPSRRGRFDSRAKIYWPRDHTERQPYKLTTEQIEFIQRSGLSGTVLAKRFSISEARVSQIRNGKARQCGRGHAWWLEGRQANDNRKSIS